ncbi:cytochrome c oxidase assembly factor 1 homolog isoform X5 [Manis javanica]|uniref:cytochrome c oxidase assembly factor 1 homolog isoform X5 n=1 Tax=Manis javanica TaxID=9974 RepID=UPI00187A8E28|nr:cytochrome c oxidase assembly factor 1 homolog isoform X6 [Manis javanica]
MKGQLSFDDFQESCAMRWQKSPGSRMPMPLSRLILFSGVMAGGSWALIYYLIQKTFSRASYYQLGLEQLHSHPEALEALGCPLSVHFLQLTDKHNFVDIADAQPADALACLEYKNERCSMCALLLNFIIP